MIAHTKLTHIPIHMPIRVEFWHLALQWTKTFEQHESLEYAYQSTHKYSWNKNLKCSSSVDISVMAKLYKISYVIFASTDWGYLSAKEKRRETKRSFAALKWLSTSSVFHQFCSPIYIAVEKIIHESVLMILLRYQKRKHYQYCSSNQSTSNQYIN